MRDQSKGFNRLKVPGLLAAGAMLAITAACSGGNQPGAGSAAPPNAGNAAPKPEQPAKPAERPTITVMNAQYAETTAKDDVLGMKLIEDITGYDLKVTWVPSNVYKERLNVTMASGEMPQAIRIDNNTDVTIINAIHSDMFWEITPYLKEFPNLATFHPVLMEGAKVDGKMYSIPRPSPISSFGTIIREDWLKKVGKEAPKTLEQLYELAKAFAKQDPDGNGKDDTYGLMLYEGRIESPILAGAGAPNNWKVENGQFIKSEETPEYMAALKWLRKMYEEGLVNAKFPIVPRNEVRNDLYNGKVGITLESVNAVPPLYLRTFAGKGNPVVFDFGPALGGKAFGSMPRSGFMIPKQGVKTEKELKTVLAYFDKLRSPEGEKQVAAYIEANETAPADKKVALEDIQQMNVNDVFMYAKPGTANYELANKRLDEFANAVVLDPSSGLISPTNVEKGSQLSTILQDASVKFVLGEIDEAGFAAAVAEWKKIGGSQVAKEFEGLYKK